MSNIADSKEMNLDLEVEYTLAELKHLDYYFVMSFGRIGFLIVLVDLDEKT